MGDDFWGDTSSNTDDFWGSSQSGDTSFDETTDDVDGFGFDSNMESNLGETQSFDNSQPMNIDNDMDLFADNTVNNTDWSNNQQTDFTNQDNMDLFDNTSNNMDLSNNSQSQSNVDWSNNPQGQTNNQQDYWANQQSFDNQQQREQKPPKQFNFGHKTIALMISGGFIFLALIFAFINGIKINKKSNNQGQQTQSSQQVQQDTQQVQDDTQKQSNPQMNGVTLIDIPDSMKLDYSNLQQTSGVIVSKKKYLINNQVIYDLVINISAGTTVQETDFYCTYSAYNNVNEGDAVQVSYYQVQEGYFSINEVVK